MSQSFAAAKLIAPGSARRSLVRPLALLLALMLPNLAAADEKLVSLEDLLPVRPFRSFDRTNAPGLSQSTITALAQDEQGILWIGTYNGIATYNGLAIEPIAPAPAAPSFDSVYALVTLRGGGICVGATNGVHVFQGGRWLLLPSGRPVSSVAEGADGRLWMIDWGSVLQVSSRGGNWQRREVPGDAGLPVGLQAAKDGAIWVACRSNVLRLGTADSPEKITARALADPISAFLVAADGTCWVGTRGGDVYYARRGAREWKRVADGTWQGGEINCVAEDRRGRVWAGGVNGWVKFGGRSGRWTAWNSLNGLRHSSIMCIFADREGSIWFGHDGNGLQQLVSEAWSHRVIWPALGPGAWRAATFSISGTHDGGVIAACFNNGVWIWDGRSFRVYGVDQGLPDDVRVAIEPEPGRTWVGGRYGLYESMDRRSFHQVLSLAGGVVTGIFRSPGGEWHLATSRFGIFRHERGRWAEAQALNRELPDLHVRHMAWLASGDLVVSTPKGATFFRKDGKAEVIVPSFGMVERLGVNVALEVTPGEVWLGGFGGIAVLRGEKSWSFFASNDGIPGKTIYSLLKAPDGSIWAGGSKGVGRYSQGRWTVYDSNSGLIEDECNQGGLWLSPQHDIWVGTMASMARFDTRIQPRPLPGLRVFWLQTPPAGADGVVRLDTDARRLVSLRWLAPWLAPQPVEYRYRIPRLDDQWSPPQRSGELKIQNLGPGKWSVDVAARLEGASDWTSPVTLRLFAVPRLWERWWAYVGLITLLPIFVFLAMRWRSRRLVRRAAELQALVEEELASIRVLKGLLPICASCKKIRDDTGYWNQIEGYIREHSEAEFSHGLCPECAKKLYADFLPEENGEGEKAERKPPPA